MTGLATGQGNGLNGFISYVADSKAGQEVAKDIAAQITSGPVQGGK
jgi:hypothetical protein